MRTMSGVALLSLSLSHSAERDVNSGEKEGGEERNREWGEEQSEIESGPRGGLLDQSDQTAEDQPNRKCLLRTGRYFGKRFCNMFSVSSTVVLQLPCCPGKQGELLENCLQILLPK